MTAVMAGTDPNFDAAEFRDAIHSVMAMAAPTDVSLQVTFRWNEERTFATEDPAGLPYDWTETPTTDTQHAAVIVPVAVQFASGSATDEGMGSFDASQAVLTLLDVDYDAIKTADYVTIGGQDYDIEFVAPPVALFEVTVFTLHCRARTKA